MKKFLSFAIFNLLCLHCYTQKTGIKVTQDNFDNYYSDLLLTKNSGYLLPYRLDVLNKNEFEITEKLEMNIPQIGFTYPFIVLEDSTQNTIRFCGFSNENSYNNIVSCEYNTKTKSYSIINSIQLGQSMGPWYVTPPQYYEGAYYSILNLFSSTYYLLSITLLKVSTLGKFVLVKTIDRNSMSKLPIISGYPWIGTVAFSASSRFLYCCSSERVIQYDLFDKEYYLKGDTVAYHNGVFPFGLSTYFCHMALAPDDKIYISSIGSSYYIHTIDQPEVKGIGCNVLQQNIKIKKVMYSFFPQFPNYRLGALIGSGCDTLFNHDRPSYTFEIHPNPVHDVLKLVHKQGELFQNFSFEMFNIEGKKVLEEKLSFNQNQWDIPMKNNLSGIYIYRIIMNQMIVAHGKAILVR